MRVTYTEIFKRHVRKLKKRYGSIRNDLEPLIGQLREGVLVGDRVKGLNDIVYKVRIKNSDNHKGKSGGYRVIYYLKTTEEVRLMAMYSKSDKENMSEESLRRILHID